MYEVKDRFYSSPDQFGESFVLVSDNGEKDLRCEPGTKVKIVILCSCGEDADMNWEGKEYFCLDCFYKQMQEKEKE